MQHLCYLLRLCQVLFCPYIESLVVLWWQIELHLQYSPISLGWFRFSAQVTLLASVIRMWLFVLASDFALPSSFPGLSMCCVRVVCFWPPVMVC